MFRRIMLPLLCAFLLIGIQIVAIRAQQSVKIPNPATDWPMFSHDLNGTRFSPLKQITVANVSKLKLAWQMPYRADRTGAGGGGLGGLTEVTPIVVNDVMFVPAENRVLALEAATGKEIWKFDVAPGAGGALSKRGVTYWPGEPNIPARIFVTAGRRLIALNATTGESVQGFGNNGEVDIVVPYNSPPSIYKNLLFIGANVPEQPRPDNPATRAHTMLVPARRSGNSIPFPSPAKKVMRRGLKTVGKIERAPTTGASI